jgi:hypothetical protein
MRFVGYIWKLFSLMRPQSHFDTTCTFQETLERINSANTVNYVFYRKLLPNSLPNPAILGHFKIFGQGHIIGKFFCFSRCFKILGQGQALKRVNIT